MSDKLPAPLKVRWALCYYLGAWAALAAVWLIAGLMERLAGRGATALLILVIGYLVIGAWLNRMLLPRLIEWHPFHATIANVSASKFRMLVLWPVRYPFLFVRLGIIKHL